MIQKKVFVHEDTYRKNNLVSFIHKSRLDTIKQLFQLYINTSYSTWADFGCSNGFVIEQVLKDSSNSFSTVVGYDHSPELLKLAENKNILKTHFKKFNLNQEQQIMETFQVVTCFETLEHVGNIEKATLNLYNHLDNDGLLIITIPNETGIVGLTKYLGRLFSRKNPYGDFFKNKSQIKYILLLLKNGFINIYREPNLKGYGPHLGFDYRVFEDHLKKNYIDNKKLKLIKRSFTTMNTNLILVLKKS